MPRTTYAQAILCALAVMGSAQPAAAGPTEVLKDVAFHPTDEDVFAAVYAQVGGGLLLTKDGGRAFELLCTAAITGSETLGGQQWVTAFTEDGRLLFGGFDGLFRGDVAGCGFELVPELEGLYVRQLLHDPDVPSTLYAVTASGEADNALFVSRDDGDTWQVLHGEAGATYHRVMVSRLASGEKRIVASLALHAEDGSAFAYIESRDGGESFTRHELPATHSARLLGFDRAHPERAYAAVQWAANEPFQVLSRESKTGDWESVVVLRSLGSFTLEPQGGFNVVDDTVQRLWRFDGALNEREHGASAATCIASDGDSTTWLCQGHLLYRLQADGSLETPAILDLNDVSEMVACDDVASQCAPALAAGYCTPGHYLSSPLCIDDDETVPDAGTDAKEDAGTEDAAAPEPEVEVPSGCRSAGSRPAATDVLLVALALWLARRRHAQAHPQA